VQRCTNPRNPMYKNYGARGIFVCDEWRSFKNFERDMGAKPSSEHSIERINNDDGYYPGNCKWATTKEQAGNKRHALGESGVKGVVRNKNGWLARFYDGSITHNLGTWNTVEEAEKARLEFVSLFSLDRDAAIGSIRISRIRRDSKTGRTGVTFTGNKFAAYYTYEGRKYHVGHFDTIQEAVVEREKRLNERTGRT